MPESLSGEINELLVESERLGEDKPVAVLMSLSQLHLLLLILRSTKQLWSHGKHDAGAVAALDAAMEPLDKAHAQVRAGMTE